MGSKPDGPFTPLQLPRGSASEAPMKATSIWSSPASMALTLPPWLLRIMGSGAWRGFKMIWSVGGRGGEQVHAMQKSRRMVSMMRARMRNGARAGKMKASRKMKGNFRANDPTVGVRRSA